MKEISIKSKIVGRAVDSTTASKGGAMPVDLSAYLPKAVWEKVFKLVTDEAGNEHLFANLPFASKYGITMFANDGSLNLPNIYDGLPIDWNTIYWEDVKDAEGNVIGRVLKAAGGGGEGGTVNGITLEQLESYLGVKKYATQLWVEEKGYLSAITSKLITDALGFTPYDSAKLSGDLGKYLPLSGGILTGNISNPLTIKTTLANSTTINFYANSILKSSVGYNNGLAYLANEFSGGVRMGITDEGLPMVWDNDIGDVKHQLAYITSNVASATKLQTARTIWGQPFDGTGDVSGNLLINSNDNGSPITINDNRTTSGVQTIRFNRKGVDAFGINWFHDVYKDYAFTSNCLNIGSSTGFVTLGMWTAPNILVDIVNNYVGINNVNPSCSLDVNGSARIDGIPIYKSQDGVLYIEGNLAVKGGITMYATDAIDVPTIMNSIATDEVNLKVIDGVLTFVGRTGGGVADSVHWDNVDGKPSFASVATSGKYSDLIGRPTLLSSFTDDVVSGKYLPLSGGILTGNISNPLTIKTTLANSTTINFYANSILKSSVGYNNGLAYLANEFSGGVRMGITDEGLPMVWDNDIGDVKHQLAYITSNVASATKLQTARTIWGQPFDGTGDVSGNLLINSNDNGSPITINDNRTTSGVQTIRFNRKGVDAFGINWFHDVYKDYAFTSNCLNIGSSTGFVTLGMWTAPNILVDIVNNYVGINKVNPSFSLDVLGGLHSDNINIGVAPSLDFPNYINSGTLYSSVWHTFIGYNGRGFIFGDDMANNIAKLQTYKGASSGFSYMRIESAIEISNMAENPAVMRMCVNSGGTKDKNPNIEFMTGFGYIDWHYEGDTSVDYTLRIIELEKGVLQVSGNILSTGGITMYSDIRKKTKLQDVELSLKQIADAPLIKHYYNSDEKRTTHVGSIAQYWAELNDWFCKLDGEGFYTMEIQNAALASAISIARELQRYESKTDKKIRLLKKKIGELEEEIEKLKTA